MSAKHYPVTAIHKSTWAVVRAVVYDGTIRAGMAIERALIEGGFVVLGSPQRLRYRAPSDSGFTTLARASVVVIDDTGAATRVYAGPSFHAQYSLMECD